MSTSKKSSDKLSAKTESVKKASSDENKQANKQAPQNVEKSSVKSGDKAKTSAKKSASKPIKSIFKSVEPVAKKPTAKEPEIDPKKLEAIKNLLHKPKHTPAVFKVSVKKQVPVVFTLEDVREVLKLRSEESEKGADVVAKEIHPAAKSPLVTAAPPIIKASELPPMVPRVVSSANLADILGFVPAMKKPSEGLVREVPRKWAHYHRLLIELRTHLRERLNIHTEETLKRSNREDAGDHSGISQHIADVGTDSFDRDFALGLVSNEKEALAEIEAALERIYIGTYGICEITQQTISKERLEAVPFTRYSLEGQAEYEKTHRRIQPRTQFFADITGDEAGAYGDDSPDE